MDMTTNLLLVIVCLGVLLQVCWTKSVLSSWQLDNGGEATIKCSCVVMADMYDDSPYHNYGVIQTYHTRGAHDECHHILHHCKKQCALRTDLGGEIDLHNQLGRQLCMKLGIPTIADGAKMTSHATLEGVEASPCFRQNAPFTDHILRAETSENVLCCGNAAAGVGPTRLGWNPDCKAKDFVMV